MQGFKRDFSAIKVRGFVKSNRKHNTGIGKTFEDLIGIYENNNQLADYQEVLELKSQRDLSESLVTLFTLVPTSPENVMIVIRDTYGTIDNEFSNRKIIHSTVSHSKFNSYKARFGFKLELDEKEEKLFLVIRNLSNGKDENLQIYWDLEEIKKGVNGKCKFIAFIKAKTKKNGDEYFHFTNAKILSGLTFQKFLDAIRGDIIVFDIRSGVYRSGKKKGQNHDHGPAFRIHKNAIDKVFDIEEI